MIFNSIIWHDTSTEFLVCQPKFVSLAYNVTNLSVYHYVILTNNSHINVSLELRSLKYTMKQN